MVDLDRLLEVAAALNREGVEYIVFGGAAVNLHGILRVTEAFDFFVHPAPSNVAAIKRALRSIWQDESIDEIQDDDMTGDYPSFRYGPPGEDLTIDFVSRLGEAFAYEDLEAEIHQLEGVDIRIATPATLIAMKRDTVRYKDRDDAIRLARKFNLPEP